MPTPTLRNAALPLLLTVAGCTAEARPQWLLTLSTDAPVPQLGDRVLVELLDESGEVACDSCRQTLLAPEAAWPLSFGIIAYDRELYLRATLYRAIATGVDGGPVPEASITRLGVLPPASEGVVEVWAALALECFGVPSDLERGESCDPATGSPSAIAALPHPPEQLPAPGSAPAAQPIACTLDVPADMACIDGGLLLMGNRRFFPAGTLFIDGAELSLDPLPEHLVRVGAFALDRFEATVGDARRLRNEGSLTVAPVSRTTDARCTYIDDADPSHDHLPVNCADHVFAAAMCAAQGKRLPTEAEWELAAGNGSTETPYPWGDEGGVCARANVGRAAPGTTGADTSCGPSADWTPESLAGGTFAGDVTDSGVHDLAGNLSERVADDFAAYGDPCSTRATITVDPLCQTGSAWRAVRGGDYEGARYRATCYQRSFGPVDFFGPNRGFRCARSP